MIALAFLVVLGADLSDKSLENAFQESGIEGVVAVAKNIERIPSNRRTERPWVPRFGSG